MLNTTPVEISQIRPMSKFVQFAIMITKLTKAIYSN